MTNFYISFSCLDVAIAQICKLHCSNIFLSFCFAIGSLGVLINENALIDGFKVQERNEHQYKIRIKII